MSSAVSAYQRAFGVDGPPTCYDDLDHADLFLVVGANMAWCHPVLFRRLQAARAARRPAPKLVVLDPRRSATAGVADLHVALRPGSDAVFLCALLAELLRRGCVDAQHVAAHTEDSPRSRRSSRRSRPARRARLRRAAPCAARRLVGEADAALSLFAMWA
jgi:assimilatory nitrate reductase catalytic subunit